LEAFAVTAALSEETRLRDEIVNVGKSLFDRGLTFGSTGISARLSNGEMLMTPTNASLGSLLPERLSRFTAEGVHVSGDAPPKERSCISACTKLYRWLKHQMGRSSNKH
jgi:3-dehydro-4-phosphotetronate decarboxylase